MIIIFDVYISGIYSYERLKPMRGPSVKRIPIRPLDYSTIKRLSRKHLPFDPDSEPIFLPINASKFKSYPVMERISSPPNIIRTRNPSEKNDNFNILNFDAYKIRPLHSAVKTGTDRMLHFTNRTDYYNDAKPSSSSQHKYRSKSSPKKSKKNHHEQQQQLIHQQIQDFEDYDFYKAFVEHQKQVAAMKKLKLKHAAQLNGANKLMHSASKLPIGIDYFEQRSKNKIPYPPITYAPLYMNNLHRSNRHEDVEASNIHIRTQPLEMLQNERMPTTTTIAAATPTYVVPVELESVKHTVAPTETHQPEEAKSYHKVANAPEMYKFTLDDAIVRPHLSNHHPFHGPVTLSPQSVEFSNIANGHYIHAQDVSLSHNGNKNLATSVRPSLRSHRHEMNQNIQFKTQINYPPPGEYQRSGYRRLESSRFPQQLYHSNHNMNNHLPMEVSASSRRHTQKVTLNPIVMTTQMTVATENPEMDQSITTVTEIDSKRIDKKTRRRRIHGNRISTEQSDGITLKPVHHKDFSNNNNLEFSNSYTKRRTQGYNSEEDDGTTTPISPIKLKNAQNQIMSESKQMSSTEVPLLHQQQRNHTPRMEKSKYFS